MDEMEFAQVIAKTLQQKTRETVLRSMRLKGFSIDGFRNLEKIPVDVLVIALRKSMRKGEKCSTVFLREVRKCSISDPAIEIVRLWNGSEEEKIEAENRLKNLERVKLQEVIGDESKDKILDQKQTQSDGGLNGIGIDEFRNKNRQLQNKIQNLKIQLENAEKEIIAEKKKEKHLKEENQEQTIKVQHLQQEILETKRMLRQEQKVSDENRRKVEFYENVLKRAPKILCFTKAKISEEDILLYNLTVCENVELSIELDWNKYGRIWISENDFSLEEIQKIKEKAIQKVNAARNFKSILERLR